MSNPGVVITNKDVRHRARREVVGLPRARSPKRNEAYKLWLDSGKKKKLKDIAAELNVSESQISKWKKLDNWNDSVSNPESGTAKGKNGAMPENRNFAGCGAPKKNKNAEKYGFFSKYLPEETVSIIQEMPTDPLDVLWDQIQISYAAIIRAQHIMYVRDKDDRTIEKVEEKREKAAGEKWQVQQAWDKQASFLSAQARAMTSLRGDIKQYDELLHKRWDLATEEQKARIQQLKANTERMQKDSGPKEEEGVEIYNDAPKKEGEDIADHHSEVSSDIQ